MHQGRDRGAGRRTDRIGVGAGGLSLERKDPARTAALHNDSVALDLAAFRLALASLGKAVTRSQGEPADDEVRDSVIQRFEYTYELAWKTLKRYLAQEGVSEVTTLSQRDLHREAAARGLLEDPIAWFGYQKTRNETSHTYNAEKAREVHARAIVFCDDASKLPGRARGPTRPVADTRSSAASYRCSASAAIQIMCGA